MGLIGNAGGIMDSGSIVFNTKSFTGIRGFCRSMYESHFYKKDVAFPYGMSESDSIKWIGFMRGRAKETCLKQLREGIFRGRRKSIIINELAGIIEFAGLVLDYLRIKRKVNG